MSRGWRKGWKRATKEERDQIVSRLLTGESQTAIAADLGITRQAVSAFAVRRGISTSTLRVRDRWERDRAIAEMGRTMTAAAIGRTLNLSVHTVGDTLRRLGIRRSWQHGRTGYALHGCRCDTCRAANRHQFHPGRKPRVDRLACPFCPVADLTA